MDPQHKRLRADSFAAAGTWTVVAAVFPGIGLIRAGRRVRGILLILLVVGALAALVAVAIVRREWALAMLVDPMFLLVAGAGLAVIGLLWVLVVVTTYRRIRPVPARAWHRVAGFLLVTALSFAIAAPTAVGARYAWSQADLVRSVFGGNASSRPGSVPQAWKGQGRLNVLLLGGDSGADRTGLRTDTVMVASIDTRTGDTVLFGLPRNTARMPFPEGPLRDAYPDGWFDGWNGNNAEYFLNSMYQYVPAAHPELFPDPTHAGGDVMKESVGEALGIPIDYYAVVNLAGFERLINALGGVTVNINSYIPMGGSTDAGRPPEKWLSPGPDQHLDGNQALWYARGRFGSDDYQRMSRQRCVMNALADQASVPTLLGRYEAIAREFQSVVLTDVPQDDLPAVLNLALLMREANMRSIVFINGVNGFYSAHPDFDKMRTQVQQAIDESHEPPAPAPSAPATPAPVTTAATSVPSSTPSRPAAASSTPTPTTASENVRDACAYDPVAAQAAIDNPPYWVN